MIKNTACRPMIHQPTPNTQSMNTAQRQQHQPRAQRQTRGLEAYLIVICFAIWPPLPPTPPSLEDLPELEAFVRSYHEIISKAALYNLGSQFLPAVASI